MTDTKLKVRFIANTDESRERGLMFAEPLADDETALFVFGQNARHRFWNKNVSFGLSLAFLDEHRRVIHLADMEANSIQGVEPTEPARFVVEAKKGTFDRLGVTKGDVIDYSDHVLSVKTARNKGRARP